MHVDFPCPGILELVKEGNMKPEDLRYTKDHEWVSAPVDGVCRVGISDFAQQELGDIVFVEFPDPPQVIQKGETAVTIESVKAASDAYAPMGGIISAINTDVENSPQLVNETPYNEGWLFEIKPDSPEKWEDLMDFSNYEEFLASSG